MLLFGNGILFEVIFMKLFYNYIQPMETNKIYIALDTIDAIIKTSTDEEKEVLQKAYDTIADRLLDYNKGTRSL